MIKGNHSRYKMSRTILLGAALGMWIYVGLASVEPAMASPQQTPSQSVGKGKATRKSATVRRRNPSVSAESKTDPREAKVLTAGRRDPFKLPPPPRPAGQGGLLDMAGGPLPPGNRGLVIGQLTLKGIVRQDATNVMLAVVTNYTNRAYFLRVDDVLFNGVVSKITPDAIYFRENYLDPNGRVQTREVVKRLGPAPGERK